MAEETKQPKQSKQSPSYKGTNMGFILGERDDSKKPKIVTTFENSPEKTEQKRIFKKEDFFPVKIKNDSGETEEGWSAVGASGRTCFLFNFGTGLSKAISFDDLSGVNEQDERSLNGLVTAHLEKLLPPEKKTTQEKDNKKSYDQILGKLLFKYKELANANSFTDIFKSLKEDSGLEIAKKREFFEKELARLKKICSPDNKGNPADSDGETPENVRMIAQKATLLLIAFALEAQAFLAFQEAKEQEKEAKQNKQEKLKGNREGLQAKLKQNGDLGEKVSAVEKLKSELESGRSLAGAQQQKEKYIGVKTQILEKQFEEREREKLVKPLSLEPKNGKTKEKENIDQEEQRLVMELNDARKKFAEVEFRDRTDLERVRKVLGLDDGISNKRKMNAGPQEAERSRLRKKQEKNHNIQSAKEPYQRALDALLGYKIDKLRESNKAGKELEAEIKKIYSFFNLDEEIKYAEVRTQVKMDYLAGSKQQDGQTEKNKAQQGWDKVREKSIKMSQWYEKKVPASVKIGLAALSFVPGASTLVFARRSWGAFMIAAAGGMQLDKLAQFKDGLVEKIEGKKVFEGISQKEGSVDFDKFKADLVEKNKNIDERLNQKNLRSSFNKIAAFAGALFLGTTIATGVHDYLSAGKEAQSTTVIGNILKKVGLGSKETIQSAVKIPPAPAFEKISIEKGSSIEGALRDHIRANHADLKIENLGKLNHNLWRNYMLENKDSIVAKVGQSEYDKMFNDGMVNIKAGKDMISLDTSNPDPTKWKITNIEGKMSHLNVVEHHHIPTQDVFEAKTGGGTGGIFDQGTDAGSVESGVVNSGSEASNLPDFVSSSDQLAWEKFAQRFANAENSNIKGIANNIRKQMFDQNSGKFNAFKGRKVLEVLKDEDLLRDNFSRKARILMKDCAGIKQFAPKSNETFDRWTVRMAMVDQEMRAKMPIGTISDQVSTTTNDSVIPDGNRPSRAIEIANPGNKVETFKTSAGNVTFKYDSNGKILKFDSNLHFTTAGPGDYFLKGDFRKTITDGFYSKGGNGISQDLQFGLDKVMAESRTISGQLKVYEELIKSNHPIEAREFLREIYRNIEQFEKGLNGKQLFDRTKLPKLG